MTLGFPTVVLTAQDILNKPLSWLALQLRDAINRQGTREQVEAYAGLQREFVASMRGPLFFGDTGTYNSIFSKWRKAGLFDFDFAVAATHPRLNEGPLQASYIQCPSDPVFADGWPISGKDKSGNYWISGFREKGLWAKVEVELRRQETEGCQ